MYYTSPRLPKSVSTSADRKQGPGTQRVLQVSDRDGEKLSPVDFNIRDAVSIQLPPLQWVHYNVTPSNVTVRNTGFTLMINAAFHQQIPYVCSGPLTGDYVFAQIHFHWGEHDETGSGHAIDGMRYPLEMHVVHLKRDCANLGEAFSKKDGIAVMVHMFALREERNTHLDQLTAILQFIHKPKCCARLYPTPLSEIVQPFTSDYFLYWGAVGSPRGQYRILWFLSRNVLPVSAQQLGEFRQLCNSQGKALVSNTNKPYPLAERSLFLVSPSEQVYDTMCGVSQRKNQNIMVVDSDESIDLRNAEFKSLADLDDMECDDSDNANDKGESCQRKQCRICPVPRRLQQTANINVGYPFKVNEGDTSVEESCIDLDSDPGVTVKTETKYKENTKGQKVITNVNVTTFRPQKYRPNPTDAVYSVVSSRGSELHLRRKPVIVRPSDPSREQACMLLSQRSSTYQTFSAPSLTGTTGYLANKKRKSTDLSDQPVKHMSSELAVYNRDSETFESTDRNVTINPFINLSPNTNVSLDDRVMRTNNNNNRVVTQETKYSETADNDQRVQTSKYETYKTRNPDGVKIKKQPARPYKNEFDKGNFYFEEVKDTDYKEENSKYLVLKRQEKKSFPNEVNNYPIRRECNNGNQYIDKHNRKEIATNMNSDVNKTTVQNVEFSNRDTEENYLNNRNNKTEIFQQYSRDDLFTSSEYKEKSQKRVVFKEEHDADLLQLPKPIDETPKKDIRCQNGKDNSGGKTGPDSDAQYKVRLLVRTTISDHRKQGKKGKHFYVTKISPLETNNYITPKGSKAHIEQYFGNENDTGEYYYAKPLDESEQTLPEKDENVAYSNVLKEQTDHTQNALQQLNPKSKRPHTLKNCQNENEDGTYHYEEEYIENEVHKSKNETFYKRTNYMQPQAENKKITEQELPRKIDGIKHEKRQPKTNGSLNTQVMNEENITNKNNLAKHTNTIQCQNDPDIRIVDETVTGKVGETKSTDVFIKRRTTEMVKPEKTDVSEEVDYTVIKSKHPKTQNYIDEPSTKSQPRAVITQTLCLDQKITGHSQVRQTVEYHDKRGNNKTDLSRTTQEVQKESVCPPKGTNCSSEFSEEEETIDSTRMEKTSQRHIANNIQTSIQQENIEQPLEPLNEGQSTVIEEYYTNKKSSKNIKTHQHTRTESNSNKLLNKNKNTLTEGNRIETPVNNKNNSRQDTVDGIENTQIITPNTNVNVEIEPSSPQKNQTRTNENSGNFTYEHEETSNVNKRLTYKTRLEKTAISRGEEIEVVADKTLQKPLPGNITENKMLNSKNDQSDQKKTSNSIYQPLRDKEACPSKDNSCDSDNSYEEVTEESFSGYKTQKTKKTIVVQRKGDPSYKFPKLSTCSDTPNTNQIIPIKKIEIPEPHYITRIPKQPLVEYEAYPVDPQQPFEIVTETMEEMSSTVKTNKTFMMFKKINGKAILNQPSVIEPMKMERNQQLNNQYSDETNRDIVETDQGVKQDKDAIDNCRTEVEKPLQKGEDNYDQTTPTTLKPNRTKGEKWDKGNAYELSETSITSQRTSVHKEKRYKLTIQKSSVNKEAINEPITCPLKQSSTSEENTSTNNMKTDDLCSVIKTLPTTDQTQFDGKNNKQTTEIDKNVIDNRTKEVNPTQVTLPDKISSPVNREILKVVNDQVEPSCKVPVKVEPLIPGQLQYTNEEFYESTTKEEKFESSQKRYVSMRGNTRIVNTRPSEIPNECPKPEFVRNAGKDLKYPDNVPTRDFPKQLQKFDGNRKGFDTISESFSVSQDDNQTENPKSNNQRASDKQASPKGQQSPTSLNQKNTTSPAPSDGKTDGDIVIFIRQPRSRKEQVTPKITVDMTEKQLMTPSELDAQKVQVHEIKTDKNQNRDALRNPIVPRKSKSAGNYSFSSSDSNEEQVIDTTQYNLTLKSETKVELDGGRSGRVKSKNEVRITPLDSRPGSPAAAKRGGETAGKPTEDADSESRDDDGDSSDSTTSFEEPLGSKTGFNQSPIKINTQAAKTVKYPKLQFFNHWNARGDALLENNGKTLRGSYIQETSIPYIQGGPLNDNYVFSEVHFHWGYKDCCGAEHIIDGQRYAVEAHFLYFKKEYGLLKEALAHDDGLAIVAVNLTVGGPPNPQLGELLKDIGLLREPNTGAYVPARSLFSWAQTVIQTSKGYYSYKGTLSIEPPQVEAVTWMVFPEPIVFCCQQSQEFRKLKSSKGAFLTKNFRPPQPLNNRTVYFAPS